MNLLMIHVTIYFVLIALILCSFCIKNGEKHKWIMFVREHLAVMAFLLAVNTVSFALSFKDTRQDYYIKRAPFYGQEKEYPFKTHIDGQEMTFELTVPPKKMKPKEADKKMEQAFSYLEENLKGENESLNKVNKPLDISLDYENYPFDIEVKPKDYSLIDEDGVLRNDREELLAAGFSEGEILSGISSSINIRLNYGELTKAKDFEITIFPKEDTDNELMLKEIKRLYQRKEKESEYEDGFFLPASYKDIDIKALDGKGINPLVILVFGIIIAGLLIIKEFETKRTAAVREKQALLKAYPWFVNELVLLLGAGMQVRNVFALLIKDYENTAAGKTKLSKRKAEDEYRRPLLKELLHAKQDFDIGMSEGRIYYELGRRLKLPCYIKILTLLEQNVTKGSKGLVAVLEQEERTALEERMNLAKKSGEEAGTKLLGPMILLLIIVMLMIMVPAFMSFI